MLTIRKKQVDSLGDETGKWICANCDKVISEEKIRCPHCKSWIYTNSIFKKDTDKRRISGQRIEH